MNPWKRWRLERRLARVRRGIDQLAAATEETRRLDEEIAGLIAELLDNQDRMLALSQQQGRPPFRGVRY